MKKYESSQTPASRVQMAEQLLLRGVITSPEQYFSVINTGQLTSIELDDQSFTVEEVEAIIEHFKEHLEYLKRERKREGDCICSLAVIYHTGCKCGK